MEEIIELKEKAKMLEDVRPKNKKVFKINRRNSNSQNIRESYWTY